MQLANDPTRLSIRQRTIAQPVTFVGIGLHRGQNSMVTIRPAPKHSGIQLLPRGDTHPDRMVAARWYNVTKTDAATTLGNDAGVNISTVEHLLAALYGLDVDNALIEVEGPEVPILDGSAEPYVDLLLRAGFAEQGAPRRVIYISRPIEVHDGARFAMLLPSLTPRVTVSIDFPGTPIGAQTCNVVLTPRNFIREIASARTFGLEKYLTAMRERGLIRGASVRNGILVRDTEIVSEEPLRFPDEFVRHKVLDVIGDLALAGAPICGHIYCNKPGHDLNLRLVETLFANRESWTYVTAEELYAQYGVQGAISPCCSHRSANA